MLKNIQMFCLGIEPALQSICQFSYYNILQHMLQSDDDREREREVSWT